MTDIKLPQLGESIAEGTVALWLVDVGGWVEADQPLVQVTTDKADVDIPSPVGGVLKEILVGAGATVNVGTVIARIDETLSPSPPAGEGRVGVIAEHPLAKEGLPAVEVGRELPPTEKFQAPPEIIKEAPPAAEGGLDMSGYYSPAVMRLAIERGVDLKSVKGTGEGGRVTKADVLKAERGEEKPLGSRFRGNDAIILPSPPAATLRSRGSEDEQRAVRQSTEGRGAGEGLGSYHVPTYDITDGDTTTPFSHIRRIIADHMVYSKRTSAHVTTFAEVDLDRVVGIKSKNKARIKQEMGIELTFLPFVMHATARALKDYPLMNSVVQGETILSKRHVNLGVAVDTERGLMVPVIRRAEEMGLVELARAVNYLSEKVRDRKITPDELAGGTFTVTNPGRKGNLFGTPIISQPQVGVLRMGEVVKRPVVVDVGGEDGIVVRPMMYLSLSYDHRVVDGLTANEFLHRVKEYLEAGEFAL